MRKLRVAATGGLLLALVFTGCTSFGLRRPPLEVRTARIITDNDAAFQSKLDVIRNAKRSLDLIYYIYSDDYSSSVFTKALLDAARRGVKVRLLVDYSTNYQHLDMFSMMEARGNGNLEVRLYGRPTHYIVRDAAYLTLGCSPQAPGAQASAECQEKLAQVDQQFAAEKIGGVAASELDISNLNVGNSGLFLSGFYAKQFQAVALAVSQGQSPEAAQASFELLLASIVTGIQADRVSDNFGRFMPTGRSFTGQSREDWVHVTDYTHHKLLLADDARLQMGGRNVEDSYHMKPNKLATKYVFMDTDLYAEIAQGGRKIGQAFDGLWSFKPMVATLAEVRQHAPNDFVANFDVYTDAEKKCKEMTEPQAQEKCRAEHVAAHAKSLQERMAAAEQTLNEKAGTYRDDYKAQPAESPEVKADAGASFTYLENLPFNPRLGAEKRRRIYGAVNGKEGESGKGIHEAWVHDMPAVCKAATAEHPKTVLLHQAYFFPASNLTAALGSMIDGKIDCSHVTIKVLTNSFETTDLNIVNLLARHWLKAFLEYYDSRTAPQRRARFEYHEYLALEGKAKRSLHTKVSVLGDELLVGSANADVRSYYMDTNNVMRLRGAPRLLTEYTAFVDKLLSDPARTRDITEPSRALTREQMLAQDKMAFAAILSRYNVDKRLNPQQIATLESVFLKLLDDAYTLTQQILDNPESPAAAKFNLEFEGI